jgi:hypothetical protein
MNRIHKQAAGNYTAVACSIRFQRTVLTRSRILLHLAGAAAKRQEPYKCHWQRSAG